MTRRAAMLAGAGAAVGGTGALLTALDIWEPVRLFWFTWSWSF